MSGRQAGPTYARIKRDILAKIRQGEWCDGHRIPSEMELTRTFDCSRMTVHRALRELASEGVVTRRRRAGTRVTLEGGRNVLLEIARTDKLITDLGHDYRYELVARARGPADAEARAKFGSGAQGDVLKLVCLHYANEKPFQLEERWINLEAVPSAGDADFTKTPPGTWLLRAIPWSDAEQIISAQPAAAGEAKLLDVELGAALLVIERRTWLDRAIVTFARLSHPGSVYHLKTTLSR
ncbi:MAG: histidine utilization repressor [Alphaproteobacteria bacterium]